MARIKGSVGSETRSAILAAALPLVAGLGYAAVSMRGIAAAAGISAGAIYNHFPNKQCLLFELMNGHMRLLLQSMQAGFGAGVNGECANVESTNGERTNGGKGPAVQLADFVRFHIRFHIEKPLAVFISYMELRSLEPENRRVIEEQRDAYEAALKAVLKAGQASGCFRVGDTDIAAKSILGSLTGVNTWYRTDGRLSPAEIENQFIALTLHGLGVQSGEQSYV